MRAATMSAGATARARTDTSPPLTRANVSAPAATKTRANVPKASAASRRSIDGGWSAGSAVISPGEGQPDLGRGLFLALHHPVAEVLELRVVEDLAGLLEHVALF